MNVKNWNSSYKGELKQNILDTISLWGAIGLLWYAFISIIGEHFPKFLQTEVLVWKDTWTSVNGSEVGSHEIIGMDWWVISLFILVLFIGFDWTKKYLKKWLLPCRLAGFGIPIVYTIMKFDEVRAGILYIINSFQPIVNSYYKVRFPYMEGASEEQAVVGFTAVCMVLWGLVWLLAYGCKRRIWLVVFPVLALGSELAVGLSPVKDGVMYILFAAVLLALLGGTSIGKKVVVLISVWVCVWFTGICFQGKIEELSAIETKQRLLRWQKNLSLDDLNPFKWLQIDFHFNWEQLDNNAPKYTGKTILEIESDKKPEGSIYLKGFYGTKYENGNWAYDDSAFKKACRKAGKDPQEVAEQIFQMPYERMYAYEDGFLSNFASRYTIFYVGATGDVAYAPYVSDYTSMDDSYTFLGDYLLKKSIWNTSISVTGINCNQSLSTWEGINNAIAIGTFGYEQNSLSSYLYPQINLTDQLEELEWINSLAENYLQVPEEAEFITDIGKKIEEYLRIYENKTVWVTGMEDTNYRRLICAALVGAYLDEQMSYSLKLDNLPMGADPIEYALTESHEGYCMHFASAATLLLRQAGVPARYVSGYTIEPSAFILDEETTLYRAEVSDHMAHAWVEIYLDNIGWVPVEVTPGGSLEALPTEDDIRRWESDSNAHRQDLLDLESESESEETEKTSEEVTETEGSESEDTELETTSESETQQRPQERPNGTGTGKSAGAWGHILKVLVVFGGIAVAGLFIVAIMKGGISRYEQILEREMSKNMTRRAVKRINRRLYYMLRLSKGMILFRRRWTDKEYRNALIECFTEVEEDAWDRYMEIVKKNHYSRESISTDEMQYCYDCYKRVKLFHLNLKEKK